MLQSTKVADGDARMLCARLIPPLLAVGAAGLLAACGAAGVVADDRRLADAHCQSHGTGGYVSNAQVVCRLSFAAARRENRVQGRF